MSAVKRSNPNLHSSQRTSVASRSYIGNLSKRNVAFDSKLDKPAPKKNTVQVLDEGGEDVTPRPLLQVDLTSSNTKAFSGKQVINFNDNASVVAPSELFNQSIFGGASTFQASYAAGFSKSLMSSMIASSRASLDSITDEIAEPTRNYEPSSLQVRRGPVADVKEDYTEEELERMITIDLEGSDTIWHLDIPGTSVSSASEMAEQVKERNEKYEKLCENRQGNDMYIHKGMQTFNDSLKMKEIQTDPVQKKDVGSMATTWDMYDTYKEPEEVAGDHEGDDMFDSGGGSVHTVDTEHSVTNIQTDSERKNAPNESALNSKASFMSSSTISLGEESTLVESSVTSEVSSAAQINKIMKMDSLKQNLFIMERTVVQNIFHNRQAAYRGLPPRTVINEGGGEQDIASEVATPAEKEKPSKKSEDDKKDKKGEEEIATKLGPNLSRLWSYGCAATKGKVVNCMVWNKHNKDILAAGYGAYGHNVNGKGLVCVWNIKNPEYPERMYETRCAVTSMDFSTSHPNFLAVGLYDGTIAVFNIRHTNNTTMLDSFDSPGKHGAPVWELKWVERDKGTGEEKGEVLVSGSADGRITQWSIRKGFEYLDLMKLKRVSNAKQTDNKKNESGGSKKSDALISRYASGMCFDFHHKDGNLYIVGTEDGHLHKCSCSYNEQFLESYTAHTGPVYRTLWSPFDDSAFLSCSADWTVRLWHQDKSQPLITLQGCTKAVHGIDWSPTSPTVFASINADQIEVWDLAISTLDPLLVNLPVTKVALSCVLFSLNSEALLVGDNEGLVTIYQMREMPPKQEYTVDWLYRVATASSSQQTDEANEERATDQEEVDR